MLHIVNYITLRIITVQYIKWKLKNETIQDKIFATKIHSKRKQDLKFRKFSISMYFYEYCLVLSLVQPELKILL